ncbi:hypothetical protein Pmgp_03833 [Pelotomaculum propionicicum]|uniref:Uncharacterized protein n=1 Tax=Pelotomaculum propionicicum TaxID=258475 RepID=A0A4Y7R8L9_9FIRM|nr:hypothetical protein Pmgp_03833 [Pelotomaculum propionicicum]
MPRAWAAMPMRPPSKVDMAILKPCPSPPNRFSLGTRQSFMITSAVSEPRMPILLRCLPMVSPGVSPGRMKALSPLAPLVLSVEANMMKTPATGALEMNILVPFRTYSSPSSTAVLWPEAASVPAPGSVRAKEPKISPLHSGVSHFCFCSSVPYFHKGKLASEVWHSRVNPVVAQAREISSSVMM